MNNAILRIGLLVVFLTTIFQPVSAQNDGELPIYIVQPGDTLNLIAVRFGISANDLINANNLANPDILNVGTELKIPGLEGFSGTLTTDVAGLGATLDSLSRKYQFSPELLVRLNRLTSPAEIFIGSTLILPSLDDTAKLSPLPPLTGGMSVLEKAVLSGQNPWQLIEINMGNGSTSFLPQEGIYEISESPDSAKFSSDLINTIEIAPLPLVQGKTEVITIHTSQPANLTGELNGMPLNFKQMADNEYVAIQGIHPLTPPGLTDIKIQVSAPDDENFTLEQAILVESGYYPQDPPLYVDEQTIDPSFTGPEDEKVKALVTPSSADRLWAEIFKIPVDEPSCIKSWYGNRRSYNGSPFNYFHTGVDYGVCANFNIYSPAPGRVVFSDELTVRGIATIIDHGWGVYSGIWHQSKTLVKAGDSVEAGQLVGEIGATGRVTGPHLHWEVWANGVQVEPLDWLENLYPEDLLASP